MTAPAVMSPEVQRKILDRTDRSGDCWLWLGAIHKRTGYAATTLHYRSWLAHRLSYETFVGPIPDGLQLDHLCRVRHCVRPEHLEPVTAKENKRRGDLALGVLGAVTHCPHGHPYNEQNTLRKNGRRHCRACANAYQKRRYAARKAVA